MADCDTAPLNDVLELDSSCAKSNAPSHKRSVIAVSLVPVLESPTRKRQTKAEGPSTVGRNLPSCHVAETPFASSSLYVRLLKDSFKVQDMQNPSNPNSPTSKSASLSEQLIMVAPSSSSAVAVYCAASLGKQNAFQQAGLCTSS
jgi:hypothetical protein